MAEQNSNSDVSQMSIYNFTVYKDNHREGDWESSGRNRIVDEVDVIGVRSVSEAAENQSFLRKAAVKQAVLVSEQSSDGDRPRSQNW